MNNMNFDENSINKIKDMMDKGELNNVISQISPEMIQNFSSMLNPSTSNTNTNSNDSTTNQNNSNYNNSNKQKTFNNPNNNFDFSNIDMNTILKMKSIMEKMNSSNDPRSNLLYSLKPYLREERKGKLDQYANLLNFAKIAELLKNDNNKENNSNG